MANLAAKCQSLEFLFFLLYRIEPYITETLFTLHRETKKSMVYRYLLYFIRVLLNLPLFSLGRYYLKVNFKKDVFHQILQAYWCLRNAIIGENVQENVITNKYMFLKDTHIISYTFSFIIRKLFQEMCIITYLMKCIITSLCIWHLIFHKRKWRLCFISLVIREDHVFDLRYLKNLFRTNTTNRNLRVVMMLKKWLEARCSDNFYRYSKTNFFRDILSSIRKNIKFSTTFICKSFLPWWETRVKKNCILFVSNQKSRL